MNRARGLRKGPWDRLFADAARGMIEGLADGAICGESGVERV